MNHLSELIKVHIPIDYHAKQILPVFHDQGNKIPPSLGVIVSMQTQ